MLNVIYVFWTGVVTDDEEMQNVILLKPNVFKKNVN